MTEFYSHVPTRLEFPRIHLSKKVHRMCIHPRLTLFLFHILNCRPFYCLHSKLSWKTECKLHFIIVQAKQTCKMHKIKDINESKWSATWQIIARDWRPNPWNERGWRWANFLMKLFLVLNGRVLPYAWCPASIWFINDFLSCMHVVNKRFKKRKEQSPLMSLVMASWSAIVRIT